MRRDNLRGRGASPLRSKSLARRPCHDLGEPEQRQRIPLDYSPKRFAGDDRQIRAVSDLIEAVKRLNALGRVRVGEIAAEKQFVDHAVLKSRYQGAVSLPR